MLISMLFQVGDTLEGKQGTETTPLLTHTWPFSVPYPFWRKVISRFFRHIRKSKYIYGYVLRGH